MAKKFGFIALIIILLLTLTTGILLLTVTSRISENVLEYIDDDNYVAVITLTSGEKMKLELFDEVAPISVENFIEIANSGAYTGSTFHRVIEDFMIQGGMVNTSLNSITGEFSSNGVENNLSHTRGVLSMARTSVYDSATSQFFIVHEDSSFLDGNYAGFGYLLSGYNVLDNITTVQTDSNDTPFTDIVIKSITIRNKNIFEKFLF